MVLISLLLYQSLLESPCLLLNFIPVLELIFMGQNKDICPRKTLPQLHIALFFSHIQFFSYNVLGWLHGYPAIVLRHTTTSSRLLHCALVLMKWRGGSIIQDRGGESGFKILFYFSLPYSDLVINNFPQVSPTTFSFTFDRNW